ncbi:MAG TPA: DoxX-like family protein [Thermoanaerobaculia bacterium]|nr:DoxX-like family protein [Thermoanaerobaculia bacterium]
MAWATAWSFDRLRLWLERGVTPAASLRTALIHTIARVTLAVVWIYQGLVPKLLVPDSGERLLTAKLTGASLAPGLVAVAGVLEILIGLALLVAHRSRTVVWGSIIALLGLTTAGVVSTPRIALTPFNAVTLTLAMLALAVIVLQTMDDAPSASRTRWS